MSSALVLTTINSSYSKQLNAQEVARCLLNPEAAKAAPGHMSSFFGELRPKLQIEFAASYSISERSRGPCKAFAAYPAVSSRRWHIN